MKNFSKIVVANWKLNGSQSFSNDYFENIEFDNFSHNDKCVIICTPIPYISLINTEKFYKGAQDCSSYIEGAFTGEISAKMLKDIGCYFTIIGHSERRLFFNETHKIIADKIYNALKANIIPILCIGENLEQKKDKLTKEILS